MRVVVAVLAALLAARESTAAYAGRRLQDVLEELRAAGLNIIYSTDLVRPGMTVRQEPRAGGDRAVLEEILAPHGLVTRPGPAGTLVVVKRRPARGGRAASSDPLQLGFNDNADVGGALDSSRPEAPATLRVRPSDVLRTPGAIDNVFRALQVLPGVTGAGLFETKIAVRGGAPDQNLTVMDGVEIHNPFRLFGAVAGFNPETIGRFELTAGAFPARYGDRLSSLLVVDTRDGRRDAGLAGSATASASDAAAVLEGRLPGPGHGSWLLAGRRTYYDLVAERILNDDLPSFDDVQLKLAWSGARGQRLALTAWRSREGSDADWSDAADTIVFDSGGANDLVALDLQAPIGKRTFLHTVVSAYRFDETVDLALQGRSDTRVSFSRPTPGAPAETSDQVLTLGLERNVGVRDVALRQEVAFELGSRHRLEAGAEVHRLRTRWRQTVAGDRSSEAANGSSILFGAGLPGTVDSPFDSTRTAAFLQHRGQFGERLVVTTGLRLEKSGSGSRPSVSPRVQAALDLGGSLRLKAGAGIHSQGAGYEKLLHSDYFLDLSRELRRGLEQERALHLVLGLERTIASGLDASLEGYYRDFSDLVVGRIETEVERRARVGRYDYPDALRWGVPAEPLITSVPVNGAEGRAYGVLVSLSRAERPGRRLSGWIAHAWGVAQRTAYGRTYPFDYDRRHALTAVASWRFGPRLELGVTGRVASGLPTTPPRGVKVLGAPDARDRDGDGDREEYVPARDESGRVIYVADPGGADTLNSSRLPTYARFDTRLTFRPRGPQGRWLFYLEALNVLNRKNAASYDWDIRLDPGAARPRIEVGEGQDGIPLLPTLGVRFHF
jgi:hypothetical protein